MPKEFCLSLGNITHVRTKPLVYRVWVLLAAFDFLLSVWYCLFVFVANEDFLACVKIEKGELTALLEKKRQKTVRPDTETHVHTRTALD